MGQVDLTAKLFLSFCLELQSAKSTYQHVDLAYNDETHSDWNLTVDQVKLSEYFYHPKRFTEAKLGSTRHQVDLALCYTRNTEYTDIIPRSTIN